MLITKAGIGFLRVQAMLALVLVGVFIALQPPGQRVMSGEAVPATKLAGAAMPGASDPLAAEASLAPRTRSVVDVYLGPGAGYAVVGLLPRASELDVVGRDENGEWLAIVLVPGSSLHGWIARANVVNLSDIYSLPIAPVTRLQS